MLYLMLDKSDNKRYAKVGYSKGGVGNRRTQYKTHNPSAIMRSSCAGGKDIERLCHARLFSLGKRIVGSEWAEIDEELYNELYEQGMGYFRPKQSPIHFNED